MWIAVVVALIIGLGGGYYVGLSQGKAKVAEEQNAVKDTVTKETKAAQEELVKAANPFEQTAGTLESGYENPFKRQNANPFAR